MKSIDTGVLKNAILTIVAAVYVFLWPSQNVYAEVKWHPGHYFQAMYGAKKSAYTYASDEIYQELETNTALVGIQLRFKWAELETAKDVYNFKYIDEHLERLSTMGSKKKRLFIIIETRTFDTITKLVPCYLTTSSCAGYSSEYEGGIFPYKKTNSGSHYGDGIRFWKNSVRDRFVKLMVALGKRYNLHSHFEGIGLGETAMGIPLDSANVSDFDIDQYYDAHLYIQQALFDSFPNTITTQFTNSPRSMLAEFIGGLQSIGTSLGGSDIFIEDVGLNAVNIPNQEDGAYSYYPKLSGAVALTPSVMPQNYLKTASDNRVPLRQPSIDELLDFGRDKLKATHMFWARDELGYYKKALAKLQTLKNNKDPRVKLHVSCPTTYGTCIRN